MSIVSIVFGQGLKESLCFPSNFPSLYGPCSSEPILAYLAFAGTVGPTRVLELESIALAELTIQKPTHYFEKEQKLVCEGRELAMNNTSGRDYCGLSEAIILHLVVKLSDLQAITVKTVCGREFEIPVEKNRNVGYVKQQIAKMGKCFVELKDQELLCDGKELEDQRQFNDICKNNDGVIHLLFRKYAKVSAKARVKHVEKDLVVSIEAQKLKEEGAGVREHQWGALSGGCPVKERMPLQRDFLLEPLIVNTKIKLPKKITDLINSTSDGLMSDKKPLQSSEGSGGAYFMPDSSAQKYVSVFKPIDEEPRSSSRDGEGLKRGTRVGEGALREVAAYILDYPRSGRCLYCYEEKGFAGVPPTVMVKCLNRGFIRRDGSECAANKVQNGSLQMFVKNNGSCADRGSGAFPVDEVHKISVLDIRLANADRHDGNILISKDHEDVQIMLIPIDHGYSLPENFEECTFFWLNWRQAKEPYSPDTIDYIKSMDAERDIELLKFHGWHITPKCARTLCISTMLLKKGAERGLTPFAIGSIMCRETPEKESVIEEIVQKASEDFVLGTSEAAFLESVSPIMDRRLDELLT